MRSAQADGAFTQATSLRKPSEIDMEACMTVFNPNFFCQMFRSLFEINKMTKLPDVFYLFHSRNGPVLDPHGMVSLS